MVASSDAEVALEIYQSVALSKERQKRLKSSTFWRLFGIRSRHKTAISRIAGILDEQGLRVVGKSGEPLGIEGLDDWLVLTIKLPQQEVAQLASTPVEWPPTEWFETMRSQSYESEREVEAFFISPLVEALGYSYEDIVIGYPVTVFRGVKKTTTEADFAVFRNGGRDKKDVLLVIEAKGSDRGITIDHVSQARSYAQELMPAYYVVTNGNDIKIFQFSAMLAPDECVMDFSRSQLPERWVELCGYIGKEAAARRKDWLASRLA